MQRAVEAHLALQHIHLRLNALDLGKTKRVDLVRGHGGRRAGREPLQVERGPVRKLPDASRDRVAVGKVLPHPGDQCFVHRTEALCQRLRRLRTKLVRALRVDGAARGERRDLRACVRVNGRLAVAAERRTGDQRARLLDYGIVGETRRMDAFTGCDLRALEGLTDGSSDFADARDVRHHVGFVVDAVEIDQLSRQRRVRPLHLIEGVEAATKWPRCLCALEAVAPEVVGGLPFRRQPRAIEVALEVANAAAPPFELRLGTALGQIVDLVVVVFTAEPRFLERAEREFFLVPGVEPPVEACCLTLG